METITNPVLIDAALTIIMALALIGGTAAALWLLPWSDQAIRSVDKSLNPVDLTEEVPLPRLAVPRSQLG